MKEAELILLPGMDGTGLLFDPFIRALLPTLRPSVMTYPFNRALSYDQLLPLVLETLPTSGPFFLLGESFSGPLALMLAARSPPGLRGVILCASFVRSPVSWPPSLRHAVNALSLRLVPRFVARRALLDGYATPHLTKLLNQALSSVTARVLAARVRSVLTVDAVAELRACTVPILYMRGEHDRVVKKRSMKLILRQHPSVRTVTLPAPHLILQTQPDASARAVHAFTAAVMAV